MTNFLVRLFVKDYERTENQGVRTSYGVLSSIVGVICNVILCIVKVTVGVLINSISVMADGFNNLSDAGSAIISFIGVKLANRPADREHPFGHGRFEYVAALGVAFLILQVGISLFKSSVSKIIHPEEIDFQAVLVGILGISILLKVWLMIFYRTLGNRINSTVIKASAADSLGDILVTLATVISTVVSGITGWKIDGYVGVVVSIFVLIAGIKIGKETLEPLLGEAIEKKLYDEIKNKVESYEYVLGTHDLIIHSYGPTQRMATIHVEVPSDIAMEQAHAVIDKIERDVQESFGIRLVIHMDPVELNNQGYMEQRTMVIDLVSSLEPESSIHDLRIFHADGQLNLMFDLVLPYSYTKDKEQRLLNRIVEELSLRDMKYNCMITIDKSFVAEK